MKKAHKTPKYFMDFYMFNITLSSYSPFNVGKQKLYLTESVRARNTTTPQMIWHT